MINHLIGVTIRKPKLGITDMFSRQKTLRGIGSALLVCMAYCGHQAHAAYSFSSGTQDQGSVALGSSSAAAQTLNFTVNGGSTITSIAVLTQGVSGLDFSMAGSSTCAVASSTNCTVDVNFTPSAAGSRSGAVVVNYDTAGTPGSISVPIYGKGSGPVAAFVKGSSSVFATGISGVFNTAVDGSGNVYATSYNSSVVYKYPAGGGTGTPVSTGGLTLGSPGPTGIAVAPNGDLYIADYSNNQIIRVASGGGATVINGPSTSTIGGVTSSFHAPTTLAFDKAGNFYVMDYGSGKVFYIDWASLNAGSPTGSWAALSLGTYSISFTTATGMAVDSSGNVYITDRGHSPAQIIKVPPIPGGQPTAVSTGAITLSDTFGVAVDPMDNLYIADSSNARIVQVDRAGGAKVLGGFTININVFGLMVDGQGNVLVSDFQSNRLLKVNRQNASMTFSSTNVGSSSTSQVNTLFNLGDAPLSIAVPANGNNPAISANFALDGASTTCANVASTAGAPATLVAGANCDYGVMFLPSASGSLSGTLTLSDDSLNIGSSSQVINLSGTGAAPANGACGSASGQLFSRAPSTSLCSVGTASAVTSSSGSYGWTCSGVSGGNATSCTASWATTPGSGSGSNSGSVSAPASGSNNNWVLTSASFSSPSAQPPNDMTFPFGLASLQLTSGTPGSSASVTINYTSAIPSGAVYMKYGKSPDGYNCSAAACSVDHWYQLPAGMVSFAGDRKSVTLTLTDGGVGDNDLTVNASITDPGGPAVPADGVASVPTLDEYGLLILSGLLGLGAIFGVRQRRSTQ